MGGDGQHAQAGDLVVVALPGVQRFIGEARSTSDVSAASGIYSKLAEQVLRSLHTEPGAQLVLPAGDPQSPAERGVPNRVVALLPAGSGAAAAERAAAAAGDAWRGWIRAIWRRSPDSPVPQTPGFPVLHWVCVPAGDGGYERQWRQAQRLLAARRRVRDFGPVPEADWRQRALCSLTPRWPAERQAPPGVPRHDKDARLSVVGWVKRRWPQLTGDEGFPSTASIASAPYRRAVLERIADVEVRAAVGALERAGQALDLAREAPVAGLRHLIPDAGPGHWLGVHGGPWVYPDRWQPSSVASETGQRDDLARICDAGRQAARGLRKAMGEQVALTGYLAVLVQDVDSMGRFLGGDVPDSEGRKISVIPNEHSRLSRELLLVAAAQRAALLSADSLGVPVYAGGDDLLAFTPAASALDAARTCHRALPSTLPRASTAVLYFHYHASIQHAMSEARRLLEAAKTQPGKHGLAVGYLRRSGASAVSIQPWRGPDGQDSAGLFGVFARGGANRLSPRLAADLRRDAGELAALERASDRLYRAELARLVRRHSAGGPGGARAAANQVAQTLDWLGKHEYAPQEIPGPGAAALVGVFLRQEAR